MAEPTDEATQPEHFEEQLTLLLQREAELHLIQRKSEQLAARFSAMQKINQTLIATTQVEEGLKYTTKILASDMSFEKVIVFLRSEAHIYIAASSGYSRKELDQMASLSPADLEMVIEPLQNERMAILADTKAESQFANATLQLFSLDAFLVAPLRSGETVIGAVLAGYSEENAGIFAETLMLSNGDIPWFSSLCYQLSSMIANVRLIARLHEEHARLTASIASLPLGFGIIDRNHILTVRNPKLSEFFQLDTAEKKPISFEDIAARLPQKIGGHDLGIHALYAQVLQHKTLAEVTAIPIQDKVFHLFLIPIISIQDNGEDSVIGIVMLFEDITEAKRLEQSQNSFVAITSHELRTPLTIIRGNVELLLLDTDYSPDKRKRIEAIHQSTINLLGIVNSFLDLTAMEESRITFLRDAFDAYTLAEEVCTEIKERAEKKGIKLVVTQPTDPISAVVADRDRIKEALINLISNAIQYTEHGTITLHFAAQPNGLKILVTDTGIGISPSQQNALFQRFQTVGEHFLKSTEYGSGMGLYITKLLMQGMGGDVTLEESEMGKGSTFSIRIPFATK